MPIQAEGKFAVVDVFRGSRLLARKSIVLTWMRFANCCEPR
jgi:hypothetical protein